MRGQKGARKDDMKQGATQKATHKKGMELGQPLEPPYISAPG